MEEKALIKICLVDADAIVTYPFKDDKYGKIPANYPLKF